MTVTAINRKNQFTTNGVTTEFVFDFAITDIQQVKALTVLDGVETEYLNFTVIESISTEGGTLTTNDVLDVVDLLVFRDTSLTQQLDYVGGGRFPADSHEQALDKLTLQNQDQQEEVDRALKSSISDSIAVTLGETTEQELLFTEDNVIKSSGITASELSDAIDSANNLTNKIGWNIVGDFAIGVTVTNTNDVLDYDGGLWRTSEPLPYTTDGSTPDTDRGEWLVVADGVVTGIARGLNVTDPEVVYGSVGVLLPLIVGYIHNPVDQITWIKPANVGDGETIVSVVGDQLETDVQFYTMGNASTANPNLVLNGGFTKGLPIGVSTTGAPKDFWEFSGTATGATPLDDGVNLTGSGGTQANLLQRMPLTNELVDYINANNGKVTLSTKLTVNQGAQTNNLYIQAITNSVQVFEDITAKSPVVGIKTLVENTVTLPALVYNATDSYIEVGVTCVAGSNIDLDINDFFKLEVGSVVTEFQPDKTDFLYSKKTGEHIELFSGSAGQAVVIDWASVLTDVGATAADLSGYIFTARIERFTRYYRYSMYVPMELMQLALDEPIAGGNNLEIAEFNWVDDPNYAILEAKIDSITGITVNSNTAVSLLRQVIGIWK